MNDGVAARDGFLCRRRFEPEANEKYLVAIGARAFRSDDLLFFVTVFDLFARVRKVLAHEYFADEVPTRFRYARRDLDGAHKQFIAPSLILHARARRARRHIAHDDVVGCKRS